MISDFWFEHRIKVLVEKETKSEINFSVQTKRDYEKQLKKNKKTKTKSVMAKLHTMYAAIVMLLVGVKIQCANSTNATLFSPLIDNSTSPNGTLLLHNVTHLNDTLGTDQNTTLKDGAPTVTTLIPISSTIQPNVANENATDETTTSTTTAKSTTTTKDPQLLLIPPAQVNASIAQMHNAPRKKGQIIIRWVSDRIMHLLHQKRIVSFLLTRKKERKNFIDKSYYLIIIIICRLWILRTLYTKSVSNKEIKTNNNKKLIEKEHRRILLLLLLSAISNFIYLCLKRIVAHHLLSLIHSFIHYFITKWNLLFCVFFFQNELNSMVFGFSSQIKMK